MWPQRPCGRELWAVFKPGSRQDQGSQISLAFPTVAQAWTPADWCCVACRAEPRGVGAGIPVPCDWPSSHAGNHHAHVIEHLQRRILAKTGDSRTLELFWKRPCHVT